MSVHSLSEAVAQLRGGSTDDFATPERWPGVTPGAQRFVSYEDAPAVAHLLAHQGERVSRVRSLFSGTSDQDSFPTPSTGG